MQPSTSLRTAASGVPYLDELWAEKAVKAFKARNDTRFYALEDVWQKILGKTLRRKKAEMPNA